MPGRLRFLERLLLNAWLSWTKESRKLKHDFNLAQAANVDLEKKVVELAEALKRCQDEKKIVEDGKRIVEETLENSRKELEKLQNS
jgi:predicted  nucleic acid-binding Zn-ribbon protein